MMMPANFSVMAENELVYVVGGSAVTDWAKTFNTNMVTIVGNTYVQKLVNATMGTMFNGNFGGDGLSFGDGFKAALGTGSMNGFNKFLAGVGVSAAIYNLGTASTKTWVKPSKYKVDDDHKYKQVLGVWGAMPTEVYGFFTGIPGYISGLKGYNGLEG